MSNFKLYNNDQYGVDSTMLDSHSRVVVSDCFQVNNGSVEREEISEMVERV